MTNKSTKKALLLSVLSMLMCVAMLVGTTFAWFTDSVTSGRNTIKAGNLDVVLEYWDGDSYEAVDENTKLFDDEALWEPGYTEVAYLKVSNAGTLALKYQLAMNIYSESAGTNIADEAFKLSDYIKYGVVATKDIFATREDAIAAVSSSAVSLSAYSRSGDLLATENGVADVDYVAIVVYMPTTVGNEANYKTGTTAPSIVLGVELFATQMVSESDFFGPDYDAAAPWTGSVNYEWYTENPDATEFVINSAEDLAGFAEIVNGTAVVGSTYSMRSSTPVTLHDDFDGKTVKLNANLDLKDIAWTPIGRIGTTSTDFTYSFKGTFDGQNFTVSNLNVSNEGWAGLFGIARYADIKNVKLSGVTVNSNRMAGSLIGQLYGSIENCHVEKAFIKVVPNKVGDTYDNGDKVGGIVGWLGDNGENRTLSNCSATDVQITAYRDVAGIAGYIASSTTVSGNKVINTQVTVDQITNYYGDKDFNAGFVYGRTGGAVTDDGTSVSDDETCSISEKYVKDGLEFRGDGKGEVTLYLVPAESTATTITVPAGVTSIGGYAFAYNDNIEKIILPSTVTTLNDRAFRDTTAKEVVLNEGLTNISYQAFRNATGVESVVIPSTVTTISKEAFQNSGVKTLVIPANVTTIEYGGLRDMKVLESVIIEGNVTIPVYAFRACTNLKTVVLKGDNVDFGGKGMIFTNKENGDGSAMTIYVKNETVKERLLANDTAAKDYGGYKIVVGDVKVPESVEELNTALANGGNVVLSENVEVTAAQSTIAPYGNKTAVTQNGGVFDGNGKDISLDMGGDNYTVMTAGGTIKNLNVVGGFRGIMIMSPTETVRLDNVYVGGPSVGYALNTGEGDSTQDLVVTNSSFYGWNSWALLKSASFTNCTFGQGTYWGATSVYGRLARPYVDTVFTNCAFDAEGYVLDISCLNGTIDLVDCTLMGVKVTAENFADLVNLGDLTSGGASLMAKVKVNGVLVFDEANQ
ncbi:MAG: leucine-rich repeat domain-containing protein [Clostridia bacterium]|nr:leucine-rich repeat domain-containing protein [Clostridia bacterium]